MSPVKMPRPNPPLSAKDAIAEPGVYALFTGKLRDYVSTSHASPSWSEKYSALHHLDNFKRLRIFVEEAVRRVCQGDPDGLLPAFRFIDSEERTPGRFHTLFDELKKKNKRFAAVLLTEFDPSVAIDSGLSGPLVLKVPKPVSAADAGATAVLLACGCDDDHEMEECEMEECEVRPYFLPPLSSIDFMQVRAPSPIAHRRENGKRLRLSPPEDVPSMTINVSDTDDDDEDDASAAAVPSGDRISVSRPCYIQLCSLR
jgi:hypothetical protein